jgi:hypothetical protein
MAGHVSEGEDRYEVTLGAQAQWEIVRQARTRFLRLLAEQSELSRVERAGVEPLSGHDAANAARGAGEGSSAVYSSGR